MSLSNLSSFMLIQSLLCANLEAGDLNLPTRMENILGMTESPDFIQVITWVKFFTSIL
jgi:hypothetical protein